MLVLHGIASQLPWGSLYPYWLVIIDYVPCFFSIALDGVSMLVFSVWLSRAFSLSFIDSLGDGRKSEGVDWSLTWLGLVSVLEMSSCVGIMATAGSEWYSVPLSLAGSKLTNILLVFGEGSCSVIICDNFLILTRCRRHIWRCSSWSFFHHLTLYESVLLVPISMSFLWFAL